MSRTMFWTDTILESSLPFEPNLESKRLCNRLLCDKSTISEYNILAFIASLHVLRVNDEDLLSEVAQYDPLSVFEGFHCFQRNYTPNGNILEYSIYFFKA